jgi:hypothetical protein
MPYRRAPYTRPRRDTSSSNPYGYPRLTPTPRCFEKHARHCAAQCADQLTSGFVARPGRDTPRTPALAGVRRHHDGRVNVPIRTVGRSEGALRRGITGNALATGTQGAQLGTGEDRQAVGHDTGERTSCDIAAGVFM